VTLSSTMRTGGFEMASTLKWQHRIQCGFNMLKRFWKYSQDILTLYYYPQKNYGTQIFDLLALDLSRRHPFFANSKVWMVKYLKKSCSCYRSEQRSGDFFRFSR
jgi:hypothetical protein